MKRSRLALLLLGTANALAAQNAPLTNVQVTLDNNVGGGARIGRTYGSTIRNVKA
jgi:hypothetical protein